MKTLGKITAISLITGVLIFGGVVSANAETLTQKSPSVSSQVLAGNGNHAGGTGQNAGSKKGTGTGQNAGSKKGTNNTGAHRKKGTNNTGLHAHQGTKSQTLLGTQTLITH